ncbi:IclR family acetate operon transcriptional repressor [Streptomyces sp. SAI-144]|jgi:DNA-binding IclR family transcriptional regulator|uniref:IclR family transcriptional regulator n=1 Tax=Streptomyces sp. SAI-144 TaxID=2940544 RepID=UPI002475E31E|nr:IclR family transcriptional regulator [Streptomyces sp. SAI-144]MDH6436768.1 IclR family acetate operon transcriptional repressor [Streptomyces sp. SAI-144]
MTSNGSRPRDHSVQSVERAVSILQVLASQGPSGVTEVAEALGIHKSTVFRLLATLESRGMVEQDTERGRYRIGYTMVELAAGASKVNDLSVLSHPICQELAAAVGDTVNVAIRDGDDVITIDQAIGSAIMSIDWLGKRSPIHATSAGKLFMAHMTPDEVAEILAKGPKTYTPHTIVDPVRLAAELEAVREQGYAVTSEEHEIGLAAVAAPIRSLNGQVIAAVTLSGPTFRINEDTIPDLAEQLMGAGTKISWRRGHVKRD